MSIDNPPLTESPLSGHKEGFLRPPRVITKSHWPAAVCPRPGFGPRSVWFQNPWSFRGNVRSSVSKPSHSPSTVLGTLAKPSVTYGLACPAAGTSWSCLDPFPLLAKVPNYSIFHSDVNFVQLYFLSVSLLTSGSGCWFPESDCSKPCSITYYLRNFIFQSFTFLYKKGDGTISRPSIVIKGRW